MLEAVWAQLNDLVAARMGLSFPKERWDDLKRGVSLAAREFGHKDVASCIQWLVSAQLSKKQIEVLASYLTIGETYFFREARAFEALEKDILPDLLRQRRGGDRCLRIWSAGCATGEEPYSIAILLNKMLPDLPRWHITVLATDINPRALKKAQAGIYGDWSFRDCPRWLKDGYFGKTKDGRYEVLPDIKKMVTFGYHNLVEDPYPSLLNGTNAMDVIFCRNVLMYFVSEQAKRVVQGYCHCLTDGGWLIVSPGEVSIVRHPQLAGTNHTGITLYQKKSEKPETEAALLPWTEPCDLPSVTAPVLTESLRYDDNGPDLSVAAQPEASEVILAEPAKYEEALALFHAGCYVEAERAITGLLSANQANAEAMTLLARIYANRGKLPQALVWCQNAISVDKLNPGTHYLLATILQERGQVREAVVSLKHALFLDPDLVPAHFALGTLVRHQGKAKEAHKHFENALSLLNKRQTEDWLPEAGITAGRLTEIIRSTIGVEERHGRSRG
ncbi:MAG: tetratricopeptide repeat protein [Chloroflexi bacterium]|nr:tetratricopeptide repeat protein [Chloroflexota bacterium]